MRDRQERDGSTGTLWIINQYAIRIDQPGITRHATLSRFLSEQTGMDVRIFASSSHYWNLAASRTRSESPHDPSFCYISTQPVASNGVRRVASMVWFSMRVVLRGLRERRPDIVMGSSPHPFGAISAWILARIFRVPFVLEVRDLWPDSLRHLLNMPPRHPLLVLLKRVERFLYSHADLIITLLPGSERHISRIAGSSTPQIEWIPNGVDFRDVPPWTPAASGDSITVMYAGAHGTPNALETLLEAAALLRADPRFRFVLIGDGKEKGALRLRASQYDLTNVEFRDPVSKVEIYRALMSADILAITWRDTPLYRYGISANKLYDYMAVGRPVVMAVDTPVNPLEQADAGVTVSPEDPEALAAALVRLSESPKEVRDKMGQRGRAHVEANYDMAILAKRLSMVLSELIGPVSSKNGPYTVPRRGRGWIRW